MPRCHTVLRVVGTLALCALPGLGRQALATPARGRLVPMPTTVNWMTVLPSQPNTLYIGVALAKLASGSLSCPFLPMRSTDGGVTWADLTGSIQRLFSSNLWCGQLGPFIASLDGHGVFASVASDDLGSQAGMVLLHAPDGVNWAPAPDVADQQNARFAQSPRRPTQLYGAYTLIPSPDDNGPCKVTMLSSANDGGQWSLVADPTTPLQGHACYAVVSLIADPRDPATVYANIAEDSTDGDIEAVTVSHDGGATWSTLRLPTGAGGAGVFTDPEEPGLLIVRGKSGSTPTNRWYLSRDEGATWPGARCPGDLAGACPRFTVENVFGAGRSYGFYADGVHAFKGGGPADARLALSDHLPVSLSRILEVQAGIRAGDPVYLLTGDPISFATLNSPRLIYRSADGGRTWQRLAAGVLPNAQVAGSAPGVLTVAATHHSVASVFVATYHKLGSATVGNPVTEAYLDGNVLTQDFEHLRLQLHNENVLVAALGTQMLNARLDDNRNSPLYESTLSQNNALTAVAPVPTTATQRYFPQTRHTLTGRFLRYWQTHGSLAVFGAPITQVFTDPNGDGSGRSYQMQYFQNVRLEYHPENSNPAFQVLLGLLGDDALLDRNWVVAT